MNTGPTAAARGLILEEDELREITGYRKCASQARFLEGMRVPYKRRRDGSLVVGRAAMERALMGDNETAAAGAADDGMNWKVD